MPSGNKTYRIFIDESGGPSAYDPQINNPGERFFTLAAVIIRQDEYKSLKQDINAITAKYAEYLPRSLEIKSRWIRRANPQGIDPDDPPVYTFWQNGEKGNEDYFGFTNAIKDRIASAKVEIISVTVDKQKASRLYPHKNILATALTDLWERICIYHHINKIPVSRIIFDPKRNNDDLVVEFSYRSLQVDGSWNINSELADNNLYNRVFFIESHKSIGLQIADYFAHPIKQYQQYGTSTFYTELVDNKLCGNVVDKRSGKTVYLGLKMTLSR